MKRSVPLLFLLVAVLVAAALGIQGHGEAATDPQVMQDSATGPGGGGDGDGLPFEEQIEDVADAVVDAVECVADAYESIIQDAKDLVAELWELEKTVVRLISEAAKSVADLYLEYQTFFLQAALDAASNIKDDLEEARRFREQAAAEVAALEGGQDGQQAAPGSIFRNNEGIQPAPRQNQAPVLAASGQTGTESGDSASAQEILDAIDLGSKRIEELERDLQVVRYSLMRTVEATIDKIKAKVEAAVVLAETVLLDALRSYVQLLKDYIRNPCEFLNPVGKAADIVSDTNSNLQAMIDPIKALRNDVPGAFTEAEPFLQQAQDNADASRAIIRNMRDLLDKKDRDALLALTESIAASRSMVRAAVPPRETLRSLDQGENRMEIDKATADAIRVTENVRGRAGSMESRMEEPVRAALAARQKLATDLDQLFIGQSPQMAEQIKADILTRISLKHRGENRLYSKARAFLDSQIASRVKADGSRPQLSGSSMPAQRLGSATPLQRRNQPPTGSAATQQRLGPSGTTPLRASDAAPSPASPRPSTLDPGPGTVLSPSPAPTPASPSSQRLMKPSAGASPPAPGPAVAKPAPTAAAPAVTGMTRLEKPLVRGGAAQEVSVSGSGLENARVQVVKGSGEVSDVAASIRSQSGGGLVVSLSAPPGSGSAGDDYYLRVLDGNRIVSQMRFSVGVPAVQPTRPALRPAPPLAR